MPMIEATAPAGVISREQREELMRRMTAALLKWEGAPADNPMIQQSSWGFFSEMPEGSFFVAGKVSEAPRLRVKITTPAGVLTDEARAGLTADIAAIVGEVVGPQEGNAAHWVLLREIADGSWGANGRIIRLADLAAAAKAGRRAAA